MNTLEKVKSEAHVSQTATTADSMASYDPSTMQKLEEILVFMQEMKADSGSKALVRAPSTATDRAASQLDRYLDSDRRRGTTTEQVNDEIVKTLKIGQKKEETEDSTDDSAKGDIADERVANRDDSEDASLLVDHDEIV